MKRIKIIILAIIVLVGFSIPAYGLEKSRSTVDIVSAKSAIVMDADTGEVIYWKSGAQKMYPASLTKIMTGLLAVEKLHPQETVLATSGAVNLPKTSSSIYLQPGEELTAEECLYGLFLQSGNDAANVLAENASGTSWLFVRQMNQRAEQLGATNTRFVNPHGLPDGNHYTTAYDLALITQEAIKNPEFMKYFTTSSYVISPTQMAGSRGMTNTHKMLQPTSEYYHPAVIGGKTGYTDASGYTLVTVAQQGGQRLICIVLDSNQAYNDTNKLLNFAYSANQSGFFAKFN